MMSFAVRTHRSLLLCLLGLASCASTPPPKAAEPTGKFIRRAPSSLADAQAAHAENCQVPPFQLAEPQQKKVGALTFVIEGSTVRVAKDGVVDKEPVVFGVIAAPKDSTPETRGNIRRAVAEFVKDNAAFVLVNGDVGEGGEIREGFKMLAEEISLPLFVHSGNIEWTSAFSEAFTEISAAHPNVFNMNLVRHLDWAGVHLVSLPGWSNAKFVKPGACRFGDDDVKVVEGIVAKIPENEPVVLTAHGPPHGFGRKALDFAEQAGNVGDDGIARLIEKRVAFGIFSHILEAGGRATADPLEHAPLPLPMKSASPRLYVNVGSASGFAWPMLDGSTSRGLAALFTVERTAPATARVQFIKLKGIP